MIPKVFEPLKFYCTFANQKSTESGVAPAPGWVGGWVGGGARGGGGGQHGTDATSTSAMGKVLV